MRHQDCVPSVVIYNTLIHAFCKKGKWDAGKGVMMKMMRSGCEPSEVTYHTLISGFCRLGELREALELLESGYFLM